MQKKYWVISLIAGVTFMVMAAIIVMLVHMLYTLDLSKQSHNQLSAEQKQHDLYLISYADGPEIFHMNRNILASSAINRGFDFILNYRREHIDPEYVAKHPILNKKGGAGFWLWKPYLILKTLQKIPDGSLVLYVDAGTLIRQPIRGFIEKGLSSPGKDILLFKYDPNISGFDGKYASGDILAALNCQEDRCRYGAHTWAGMLAVRNSPQSRAFIAEWLKNCENEDLIIGGNFKIANYPEYSSHHHDESILSVLANRDAEKVNSIQMNKDFYKMFHVHRRRSEEKSLIGYSSIKLQHMQRRLPNWWWVKQLEKLFG